MEEKIKEVIKEVNTLIEKKEFKKALKLLEDCKFEEPEIYNMKGIVYMNLNDPKNAEKMYTKAIRMARKKDIIPHFYYSNRAFAMMRLNKPEDAIRDVETAIQLAPNEVKLYDLLSNIYVTLGDFKKALEILDNALKIFPGHPGILKKKNEVIEISKKMIDPYKSLLDAADSRLKNKEPRIALDILENAKSYDETYELYELMARCMWDLEKYEEGYEAIDKAVKLCKDDDKKAELLWAKAKFANALKKHKEAIKLCKKAIELDKKPQYLYDLSFYLMIERKDNDALKTIDKAIKMNPTNPHYYIRKGDILSHLYRIDDAIEMYDKAIQLDPLLKIAYERKENVLTAKKYGVGEEYKKKKEMFV